MKSIGIIGAMELEIELLKNNMKSEKEQSIAGMNFCTGKIHDKDVVLTCCGVGKVNAAACTQILIDKFNAGSIINTGIAGGLNSNVKVCDLVISENVTYHDVNKRQMKNLFPFMDCFKGDKHLIDIAIKACEMNKSKKWDYHVGRIVSGECFVSDSKLKQRIIEAYSPYCVEMEGAAIGHVAYINGLPFVVIRSISDNADDDADMSYDAFEKISAEISSSVVLDMIKMI